MRSRFRGGVGLPSLDNVTTGDAYTEANTLYIDPPVTQVTVIVSNAPVFAQFALSDGLRGGANAFQGVERRMLLASWTWDTSDFRGQMISGIRVRSAVTGSPAKVTIHA